MLNKKQEILLRIFKNIEKSYNSRSISKKIGMSHAGAFKILKDLEKKKIVLSEEIGRARIYSINLDNSLAIKELELALVHESQEYLKWAEELKEIKSLANFVLLFGSVLKNEKEARDIDVLIVADKNHAKIKNIIEDKNKILKKKIHLILQKKSDFKKDVSKKNKAMLEIIQGVALFGNEEFVKELK